MDQPHLPWISNFNWRIADDVHPDVHDLGKARNAILPTTVLRQDGEVEA